MNACDYEKKFIEYSIIMRNNYQSIIMAKIYRFTSIYKKKIYAETSWKISTIIVVFVPEDKICCKSFYLSAVYFGR